MIAKHFAKVLAVILTTTMTICGLMPCTALAAATEVLVEDHAAPDAGAQEISDLVIGDVDAPQAGAPLDDTATVRSTQGQSWDVPVLWIDQDLQLATTATEDGSYLPAIAFFVPEAFRVQATDGTYFVRLADELAELFGANEVVSVYDASTGITYILPARLRDFFAPKTAPGAYTAEPAADTPEGPTGPANPATPA